MTREETTRQMEGVRDDVGRRTRETLLLILSLVESYRYLGRDFTFDAVPGLDERVNELLVRLSDSMRADSDARAMEAVRDAVESGAADWADIEDYIDRQQGDETRVERYDMYCSRLKDRWEKWIAIGFAFGLTRSAIVTETESAQGNPAASELWKKAAREGGFAAGLQPGDGAGYGRGISGNLIDGLTLTGQQAINEAFQFATLLTYALKGNVIGYRVHRGSTFDCPYCDDLCTVVHPLTEMVLPAHPRCMCWTTPVYSGEEPE